jgi:plasmid stability protein
VAQLLVPGLDTDAVARLEARARRHGRSLEAEALAIIEEAVEAEPLEEGPGLKEEGAPGLRSDERGFGTLMHERFKKIGLTEEEWKLFNEGIEEFRRGDTFKPFDFDE